MKPIKDLPIAVAFVWRGEEILLLQRKDKTPAWDKKWEFPGGKIDDGEKPAETVVREVLEETGLTIFDTKLIGNHTHDWDVFTDKILRVHLHCFSCQANDNRVILETDKAYTHVWVNPKKALEFDLLEANADIIRKFVL
ncbi:hypothetical protein CO057_00615 [Candidatus Uhrbacteria bacterium CG_4_9_14_0_2_um_filter_41_50]|uniref:8-oxo-dGTP diphosphatase n=1 Tax=Candidatus Uhrbacteria bacterium CG_4_9_14_0_2_um_filter_41_50 TaxID=1975031 RepID=A0A2M8EQ80_9BACT|nr:MAG: hypothetical protein COZ45_02020 [Candidatus Uhrbacteria bacterium CG_4_10_14_3_um_filter_41_21]PIZ54665.1 MAG: hypothetical protein COY24_02960 [Candidatus Uhrbacteria bacterium CG_4_10_14_0_2_um_filter_41_21]PJB84735.1 MAG: hypothetical protein CO086_01935 [Candidatus Uhrbacteria bacterium CG_4_9_14_0_8_um_filter_41_16]PJC24837.1 MAG: hypothetical protein CO057_00615 [Candidatus Uhrbacteria bacterium CG_4_9_14_0_2_um_filter_41_50]PJE75237.1 MAG: hypothetical protein COV03_01205 [Candi